jgi:hypothetical protein
MKNNKGQNILIQVDLSTSMGFNKNDIITIRTFGQKSSSPPEPINKYDKVLIITDSVPTLRANKFSLADFKGIWSKI